MAKSKATGHHEGIRSAKCTGEGAGRFCCGRSFRLGGLGFRWPGPASTDPAGTGRVG